MSDTVRLIEVKEDILADNNAMAKALNDELTQSKTCLVNLMASPGAGKTTTILATLEKIKNDLKVGVMEADIDSMVDAEKIAASGTEAIQIRTGGFCHMDATMVRTGLEAMDFGRFDLVILENVGNLVCPAEFETGAHINAMILSVPEGDDKPLKYPLMFSICQVLLINKIDYLELSDFNLDLFRQRVLSINPNITIFEISSRTGQGIGPWADWLKDRVKTITK
ncbi:MAG: hydrogenase nickel incorporation protein HypB [Proteobacteria bacterium]|nr:hydrogenase nickel incorporation protein HypB [Pseudomonadota bacterium]